MHPQIHVQITIQGAGSAGDKSVGAFSRPAKDHIDTILIAFANKPSSSSIEVNVLNPPPVHGLCFLEFIVFKNSSSEEEKGGQSR